MTKKELNSLIDIIIDIFNKQEEYTIDLIFSAQREEYVNDDNREKDIETIREFISLYEISLKVKHMMTKFMNSKDKDIDLYHKIRKENLNLQYAVSDNRYISKKCNDYWSNVIRGYINWLQLVEKDIVADAIDVEFISSKV